jgi:hypothetical protein
MMKILNTTVLRGALLPSYWLLRSVRCVDRSWSCALRGLVLVVRSVVTFAFTTLIFAVFYHVDLPTHLLTNASLYCSMKTPKPTKPKQTK